MRRRISVKAFIVGFVLAFVLTGYISVARSAGDAWWGFDAMKRFLASAHTWTGQQTFTAPVVIGTTPYSIKADTDGDNDNDVVIGTTAYIEPPLFARSAVSVYTAEGHTSVTLDLSQARAHFVNLGTVSGLSIYTTNISNVSSSEEEMHKIITRQPASGATITPTWPGQIASSGSRTGVSWISLSGPGDQDIYVLSVGGVSKTLVRADTRVR